MGLFDIYFKNKYEVETELSVEEMNEVLTQEVEFGQLFAGTVRPKSFSLQLFAESSRQWIFPCIEGNVVANTNVLL